MAGAFAHTLAHVGPLRCARRTRAAVLRAGDFLGDLRWQLSGHQLRQAKIGVPGLFASRPVNVRGTDVRSALHRTQVECPTLRLV